jgi:signal transduction histidine kinase
MKDLWNRISIRYKVISVIVLTILLVTVTILPAISQLIKDALFRQQQDHLESVRNLAIKLFEDYQSKVTNYTKLFSNDREIKDSLFYHVELAGEREHPLRAINRLYKSFDVSSIEIGDNRGRVVAVAERPELYDADRSGDELIKSALRGKAASGIVLSGNGPVIKASAPIYYNENQLIGTITSGILLDDGLLVKIKQLSNTDLVIMDHRGRTISSTLDKDTGRELPDSGNIVITFPFSDPSGTVIGRIRVLQKDLLPRIIARTHLTLLMLLAGIFAASVFVLFVVLNKVMKPLVKLKEGAERIGKGEFGYRIDIASKDEIGELSESFNIMAHNLEKLQSMEEKLRQSEKLAAVGKFAAGIAHEINNPIGNVIGIAKLRLKNTEEEAVREDLESIIKDAGRCARIVKDLLFYSRQSPPNKEKASLNNLTAEALNAVMSNFGPKNIEIKKELYDELPDIYMDTLQINQVLTNVLINAIQSIEKAGILSVMTARLNDNTVEVAVTDTGSGMDDETRIRIFDPFFTTKAVGEGTGLGLAISYGIVQNHGGEIIAESGKEHGSTFRIRLPLGEGNG